MESIPVYPTEEDGPPIATATVLSHEDIDPTDAGGESNKDPLFDEDDEESVVADAVVVSAENNEYEIISKDVNTEEDKMASKTAPSTSSTPKKSKKRKRHSVSKEDRIPSVKDLGVPFRAIKRIMKIDPDIATVQNEAAIVTTFALELFIKKIVNESYANARKRGRNTVKYEDLGEARAANQNLFFLETLLP